MWLGARAGEPKELSSAEGRAGGFPKSLKFPSKFGSRQFACLSLLHLYLKELGKFGWGNGAVLLLEM